MSPRAVTLGLLMILLMGMPASPSARVPSLGERVLRMEALEITGNWKTRDSVIHNLLAISAGEALDAATLGFAQQRMMASGYFHEVEISTRPGSLRGQVVVMLRLRERHRPYLDTGFGFRDPEGWYLTLLGLRSENPFGLGGRASAGIQFGFRSVGGLGELRLPLRDDRKLELQLRLRGVDEQLLWYENEPGWQGLYDEYRLKLKRSEIGLGLIWRPWRRTRLAMGLAAAAADPEETGRNRDQDSEVPAYRLPAAFRADAERAELNVFTLGLQLGEGGMDGRPGHSLHLRGRIATQDLGADRDFARWTLALRGTRLLPTGHSLAAALRAGIISGDAPYYERFRLGGSYSLRGFRDHSLSPPEGHDAFFSGAGEYRFPILKTRRDATRLSGLLFADVGQGWLEDKSALAEPQVDYERLQFGAGYGLRLHLPWLGVIGFDVGLPVTAGVTGESLWYYLTLGQSF
jgi:outer membrane protein assembly factor BamA